MKSKWKFWVSIRMLFDSGGSGGDGGGGNVCVGGVLRELS